MSVYLREADRGKITGPSVRVFVSSSLAIIATSFVVCTQSHVLSVVRRRLFRSSKYIMQFHNFESYRAGKKGSRVTSSTNNCPFVACRERQSIAGVCLPTGRTAECQS